MNDTSKEEWTSDLAFTDMEIEAYDMLARGYYILSTLPGNDDRRAVFASQASYYRDQCTECINFFNKLQEYGKQHNWETVINNA